MQKKKPKYPKSFQECYYLIYGQQDLTLGRDIIKGAYGNLLECLQMLLICRDVYWKIADFKYDVNITEDYFYITNKRGSIIKDCCMCFNHILAFPTAEMRDAFYENFKELIESCKELL